MISSTVLLTAAVVFTCWSMIIATMASSSPLFKRLKANANVDSGAIDKIGADISQSPNLTSAYLYEAIRRNRLDILKFLVENFNVPQQSEPSTNILDATCNGMNLLSVAILHQNIDIIEWMIANGANVNVGDASTQKTPLHYAFEFGMKSIVNLLIEKGANVRAKDSSNMTCLHYACISGDLEILKVAILLDMDLDSTDSDGNAPLHYACESRNVNIMRMLIEKNATVDALNKSNMTPLHHACESGNEVIVDMLIKHGADVNALNKSNGTPLHIACRSGNVGIVQILIKHDANVNALDESNRTPLHHACESGNEVIVDMLIKHGANEVIVDMLIKHGAYVSVLNEWKWTSRDYAFRSENEAILCMLTENDAEAIDKANDYMYWLHNAIKSGNEASVRYFFNHAKSLDFDDSILKDDSLLNALKRGHYCIASLLIEHGANFGLAKSQWFKSCPFTGKIELFLSNPHIFNQLNRVEQNSVLAKSNYGNTLDINLPDHVVGSRLGCILMLGSLNVLEDIKRICDQQNTGYFKFLFTQARLFLQRKWPRNGQDPELVSVLGQVFRTVFKNVNFDQMSNKLNEPCELLTGPLGFIDSKDVQHWVQRYLKYSWTFIEAIKTNPGLASAILHMVPLQTGQSDFL